LRKLFFLCETNWKIFHFKRIMANQYCAKTRKLHSCTCLKTTRLFHSLEAYVPTRINSHLRNDFRKNASQNKPNEWQLKEPAISCRTGINIYLKKY
jgi:hypothetical protein